MIAQLTSPASHTIKMDWPAGQAKENALALAFIYTVISHNFPEPRIIAKVNINDVDENLVIRVIKNPEKKTRKREGGEEGREAHK